MAEGDGGLDGAAYELSRQKPHNDLAEAGRVLAEPAPVLPGGFMVDPERARPCIEELSRIAEYVRLGMRDARQMYFDPPGYDEVSVNMARNARVMASRAEAFLDAWAAQIEATRDALVRQLEGYQGTEADNARRLP